MKIRVSVEDMHSIRNHPAHHITGTITYEDIEQSTARAEATDAEWPALLDGKHLGMHAHVDMIMRVHQSLRSWPFNCLSLICKHERALCCMDQLNRHCVTACPDECQRRCILYTQRHAAVMSPRARW